MSKFKVGDLVVNVTRNPESSEFGPYQLMTLIKDHNKWCGYHINDTNARPIYFKPNDPDFVSKQIYDSPLYQALQEGKNE